LIHNFDFIFVNSFQAKLANRLAPEAPPHGKIVGIWFGGARLLTSRLYNASARRVRLAGTLAPPRFKRIAGWNELAFEAGS